MERPFHVDAAEYPFADRWLPYRDGAVHYVDEGHGPTVLLLHGNPTWSYLYRNAIEELRGEFRLAAPDYPGFGMSRAPSGYGYAPREHSEAVPDPGVANPDLDVPELIRKARPWLAELESKLPNVSDVPAQLLWGTKDSAGFSLGQLAR